MTAAALRASAHVDPRDAEERQSWRRERGWRTRCGQEGKSWRAIQPRARSQIKRGVAWRRRALFPFSRHCSNRILPRRSRRCVPNQILHDWPWPRLSQTLRLSVGHPDHRYHLMRKHYSGITDCRVKPSSDLDAEVDCVGHPANTTPNPAPNADSGRDNVIGWTQQGKTSER